MKLITQTLHVDALNGAYKEQKKIKRGGGKRIDTVQGMKRFDCCVHQ